MPVATTVNVAVCPAATVWFAGCVVMVGTAGTGFVLLPLTKPVQPFNKTDVSATDIGSTQSCNATQILALGKSLRVRFAGLIARLCPIDPRLGGKGRVEWADKYRSLLLS